MTDVDRAALRRYLGEQSVGWAGEVQVAVRTGDRVSCWSLMLGLERLNGGQAKERREAEGIRSRYHLPIISNNSPNQLVPHSFEFYSRWGLYGT